jgi:signal transduction histidine kinase
MWTVDVLAVVLFVGTGVTIALFERLRRRAQLAEQLASKLRLSQTQLLKVEAVARGQARQLDQLLDMVNMTSMAMPLEYASLELCCVIRDAWETVEPEADAKGVAMRMDIDPGAATEPFYGDAARLQQIVANLLSNGVKFTPTGGKVLLKIRRSDDVLAIEVSDTGIGIKDDFLPLIFEPFRRADTSNRLAGFGLGLSIVQRLVEEHGGDISAASDGLNRGARFTVRLPVSTNRRVYPTAHTELGSADLRS